MVSPVFLGSEAIAAGQLSRGVLRGPRYQRVFPDVYAPAELALDLTVRSNAAYLWSKKQGVLSGYSAAELLGAGCAPDHAPAELTWWAAHARPPSGLLIHQAALEFDEFRTLDGVELTTALRTAYDLGRRESLVESVVAVDALARGGGFTPSAVLHLADRYPGARGTLRLPEVIRLSEPAAESPMESRLRMLLVLAGLPRPAVQHTVLDALGRFVARIDLAYPDRLVAIEYDGSDHFTDQRVISDGDRATRLADLGWRIYRYYARDVYLRPGRILADIRRALH
ncbi:endonuclease domain-containing protein [Pseudonocardia spinosispora]|uniref:endonuclease domain-containing protein n=1 Tax=Pseudonocardia spinosispora TaxID=103441 RepID=UPI00048E38B5|nr:DUF559 domain-containing protein [Pseudonocardia spinosispora]